jgi:hypothetical protein
MRKIIIMPLLVGALIALSGISTLAQENEAAQAKPASVEDLVKSASQMLDEQGAESAKVISFFKANFPERIAAYEKLLKENTDEASNQFSAEMNECKDLLAQQNDNPEDFKRALEIKKLNVKTEAMAESIQRMKQENNEKNKDAIQKNEKELKDSLTKLFELKVQDEKINIERAQNELDKQKDRLKKREANKDKIVGKRMGQLTGDEEALEW